MFVIAACAREPVKIPSPAVSAGMAAEQAESMERAPRRGAYVKTNYLKTEHAIPMRDGIRLHTVVYTPKDAGPARRYPILMQRTPYSCGPYGGDKYKETLNPIEDYERDGFIFVCQDVRGKYLSEGTFVNMRPVEGAVNDNTDTWDTVEWMLKHLPGNNGKVGQHGVSYPGYYSAVAAIDGHPALVAVSPQAPIANWFLGDDMHRNGAFTLNMAYGFFHGMGFGHPRPAPSADSPKRYDFGTPDGYDYYLRLGALSNAPKRFREPIAFWDDLVRHPNYDDFWKARDLPSKMKNVRAAVLTVGGWYDTEDLYGPLHIYQAIERNNPGIRNTLVMGPWTHGGWLRGKGEKVGDAEFGRDTALDYQPVEYAFFKQHLKGEGDAGLPEAWMFRTGANQWERFASWPPKNLIPRTLYFQPDGGLAFDVRPTAARGFGEYVSDPAKPVPYTTEIMTGWSRDYIAADQRFAAWRPDVLVYRSAPLREDVTLAGPIKVRLWVSITGTDADFIVKLIDVHPDAPPPSSPAGRVAGGNPRGGLQQMVRGEPMRGRFRNSFEKPEPFVPGKPTEVDYTLNDVLHTFKKGHRIMVQVQSSWFPFIDRNPQKYVPNIYQAKDGDFIKATHRVYHDARHPSAIEVGVLPAG
ncbi:CocE/NonD family hydrolase [Lysobacter pythonis]|uniref:CocE/NonD family hydrolase n=2 Tax=Solilutibacter pythonis TaxID=2483112 RepID=A0A3M2HN35_9GAMM|nr:CocE/NonD family hydrolase [Lysobacter pythonis]